MKGIDKTRLLMLLDPDFNFDFMNFLNDEYKKFTYIDLINIKIKLEKTYKYQCVEYIFKYRRKHVDIDQIVKLMMKYLRIQTYNIIPYESDTDESDLATDKIECDDCEIDILYVKHKDRYVSCPKCQQDIYVGTKILYKKGKFKRTKNI